MAVFSSQHKTKAKQGVGPVLRLRRHKLMVVVPAARAFLEECTDRGCALPCVVAKTRLHFVQCAKYGVHIARFGEDGFCLLRVP